jgi:hypothetical protein
MHRGGRWKSLPQQIRRQQGKRSTYAANHR